MPFAARSATVSAISAVSAASVCPFAFTSSPMKQIVGCVRSATSSVKCDASRPISRMKW